jgi:hypothetical protein
MVVGPGKPFMDVFHSFVDVFGDEAIDDALVSEAIDALVSRSLSCSGEPKLQTMLWQVLRLTMLLRAEALLMMLVQEPARSTMPASEICSDDALCDVASLTDACAKLC